MCETTEPEKETQPQRLKRKIVKDGRVSCLPSLRENAN